MKALVVGQGGREHALVRALKLSRAVTEVHAAPGSDGMKSDARCHDIGWRDVARLRHLITTERIDFVVIGPEDPLVAGLADTLRADGILVFAPSGEAARLEGSKIFCKEFLNEAGIPTARSFTVSTVEETMTAARSFTPPYVLKADGLAAGKGVFICKSLDELRASAHGIFVERVLGESGARALLEEFSPGYELSYLVLTDGVGFEPLPLAQDHKRRFDGDEGPNTGGMGVVAPVAIDAGLRSRIDRDIVAPTIAHFRRRGFVYRGVLFIGLMITDRGPSVLEFNTRFGDPETQAVLPLLDGDWGAVFHDLAAGRLPPLRWRDQASCCVVLAAQGYPDTPVKGAAIGGLEKAAETTQSYFLHAGTRQDRERGWVTNGGRVLNAVAIAPSLRAAIAEAYAQARSISGLEMRSDIGHQVTRES